MTHQTHTSGEVADMITDWFMEDDVSDEKEDNFGECDVYQPQANFRQSSRLLSSSSDSSKSSDESDNPDASTSLSGIPTILGKNKTEWKTVQIQLLEENLLTIYLLVQVVSSDKSQNPSHLPMTLGNNLYTK